jgi:hypothetical protein
MRCVGTPARSPFESQIVNSRRYFQKTARREPEQT